MLRKNMVLLALSVCTVWSSSRIFHGHKASKGQFPWQVALHIPKQDSLRFCGGALISDLWVLTAGHCMHGAEFRVRVLLGTLNSKGNDNEQVDLHSSEWYYHEEYDPFGLDNDIAVLKLQTPVVFTDFIKPIYLGSDDVIGNVSVTVSGWGSIDEDSRGTISDDLRYTNLVTVTNAQCKAAGVSDGMLCAVPDPDDDAQNICGGDSGGALVANIKTKPAHVGIVSWYIGCSVGNTAGYTRTSYYRDWIKKKTGV